MRSLFFPPPWLWKPAIRAIHCCPSVPARQLLSPEWSKYFTAASPAPPHTGDQFLPNLVEIRLHQIGEGHCIINFNGKQKLANNENNFGGHQIHSEHHLVGQWACSQIARLGILPRNRSGGFQPDNLLDNAGAKFLRAVENATH